MFCRRATLRLVVLAVCVRTTVSHADDEEVLPPVNLTVYYEGLDRNCADFFKNQLEASYELLDYMNVQLVPYGRTQAVPKADLSGWDFKCEHDEDECSMNMIMACVNTMLQQDQVKQLIFSSCVMRTGASILRNPNKCAQLVGLNESDIVDCTTGYSTEKYFNEMGNQTPRDITKLPMIDVNGKFTSYFQDQILEDIKLFVCGYQSNQPPPCNNGTTVYNGNPIK